VRRGEFEGCRLVQRGVISEERQPPGPDTLRSAFPGTGEGRGARAPGQTKRNRVGRQSNAGRRARRRRPVR
jgi:hypothetical protein